MLFCKKKSFLSYSILYQSAIIIFYKIKWSAFTLIENAP